MHRTIAKNSHVHFFHAHSVNVNMFSHVFHHSLSISHFLYLCVYLSMCVHIFLHFFKTQILHLNTLLPLNTSMSL